MSLKQQHYRRLMKQEKEKTTSTQKIDHPLARYSSLGQLTCVVCSNQVKNNLLWSTHLQSRKHKENVAIATERKNLLGVQNTVQNTVQSSSVHSLGVKRKNVEAATDDQTPPYSKRVKAEEPTSPVQQTVSSVAVNSYQPPPGFFDSGITTSAETEMAEVMEDESEGRTQKAQDLPTDFFDRKPKANIPIAQKQNGGDSTTGSSLPEGFFDDPKQDAKARKVEFKDPVMEEWERFQKSIQKEDDVSDALILEGDVESKEDRELTQVQEQAACYLRVESLRVKQDKLIQSEQPMEIKSENAEDGCSESSSSDEVDFDELFDWRAKIA